MLRSEDGVSIARTGLDGVALKPTECDVGRGVDLDCDVLTIDYEGRANLPSAETLRALASSKGKLQVTTPIRADGFDPLGDDSLSRSLPSAARRVLVAGHSVYLSEAERARPIAPRLRTARERAPDA